MFHFKFLCLTWLIVGMIAGSAQAQNAHEDFKFYKKYGHNNKLWNDAVEKGFAAYDAQDCNTVSKELKDAIANQCQDALVYYKLAVCTEFLENTYTAIQYYQLADEKLQKLSASHPYQSQITENYGRALFKMEKYDEALPLLSKAEVTNPSFGLLYMIGYIHNKKDKPDLALDYFQKALQQDISQVSPESLAKVYLMLGKYYLEKKDYHKAEELLNKAVQNSPTNPEASQLLAQAKGGVQQQSTQDLIKGLSESLQKESPFPLSNSSSAPNLPPPAAAKLPPLEKPLSPTASPGPLAPSNTPAPPPSGTSGSSSNPSQLAPLPVLAPIAPK